MTITDSSLARPSLVAGPRGRWYWVLLFLALLGTFFVFWIYHDSPSGFTDDAIYAFHAESVLDAIKEGNFSEAVIARYGSVPNIVAMSLFGERLVSLRYVLFLVLAPLVLFSFHILSRVGLLQALVGTVIMLTLTVIQFMNPAAGWYALALTLVAIVILESSSSSGKWRILCLGVLVGAVFFVRQLNGAVLGAGVVIAILPQLANEKRSDQRLGARLLLVSVFVVLAFVSSRAGSIGSWLMIVLAPLLLAVSYFMHVRVENQKVYRFSAWFATGILLAGLPLAMYRVLTGTFLSWLKSILLFPLEFSWATHFPASSLSAYPLLILEGVLAKPTLSVGLNAIFWLILFFAPTALGLALVQLQRSGQSGLIRPLSIVALFYALSALHLQIPLYLFFVSPLCMIGLLAVSVRNRTVSVLVLGAGLFASAIGIFFHAGHSEAKSEGHYLWGDRMESVVDCPLERSGLKVSASQCGTYQSVVDLVEERAPEGRGLLTIPNSIEVNFLTDRPQPFHNCAMAIRTPATLEEYVAAYSDNPPDVLVVNSEDKYYSEGCRRLVEHLLPRYEVLQSFHEFRVYGIASEPVGKISSVLRGESP